jgi:flagellar hook-associated protein 1 FlgK
MQVTVRDVGGAAVRTLSLRVDDDYAAGDTIALENGLRFSLSAGNVNTGDGFSFTAYASMDSAGILDALGINTFLNGQSAGDLHVVERVLRDNSTLAGALTPNPGDNHGFLQLAEVREAEVAGSGSTTLNDAYREMISEIATTRNTKTSECDSQELLIKDLQNRRDSVSGVDMDEEMVQLIEAQTLYQGALKYIQAVDEMMSAMLSIT